jgi:branched-chain amino acid transport system permease protein
MSLQQESSAPARVAAVRSGFEHHRLDWTDALPWVCIVLWYVLAPGYLPLGTQVILMIIFALSLDLALGYGGIETLGHAALFGVGAYAAGLYALHVSPEPISGLVVAAISAAVAALATGALILRARGLTLVMLTLAVATLIAELASTWKSVTGGDDGLHGYKISRILGMFDFDFAGRTAYWYSAAALAVVFLVARLVINSPFGLTVRGIRDNPVRMRVIGIHVTWRLAMLYAISGAIAGIAGGLTAQITKLVGLDVLGLALSANVLIMLVLGGPGRLYGAFVGAAVFVILSDRAAAVNPFHWLFALGLLLILTVRFAPKGLLGAAESAISRLLRRSGGA